MGGSSSKDDSSSAAALSELQAMGFGAHQAAVALEASGGDVVQAAELLLSQPPPPAAPPPVQPARSDRAGPMWCAQRVGLARTDSVEERARRTAAEQQRRLIDEETAATSAELAAVERAIYRLESLESESSGEPTPHGTASRTAAARAMGLLPKRFESADLAALSYLALVRIVPVASRGLRLSSLQAAQRRLAFALALLPTGQELTPRGGSWLCPVAELDSDVFHLIAAEVVPDLPRGFAVCAPGIKLTSSPLLMGDAAAPDAAAPDAAAETDIATAIVPRNMAQHNTSYQCAVCAEPEMWTGRHYAEFTLHNLGWAACIGCVGPRFDPEMNPDAVAHRSEQGWMLGTMASTFFHHGHERPVPSWEAAPGSSYARAPYLESGTVVGLLVDIDAACISVYVDGELVSHSLFKLEVSTAHCVQN